MPAEGRAFDAVDDSWLAAQVAVDLEALWQAVAALIVARIPCHSCSVLHDIDGTAPAQGLHLLADAPGETDLPVTSLEVAAPFLAANPRVRAYTFSQIAAQDSGAGARLRAQNPSPRWREFVHLAFWDGSRLDAVLSIRLLGDGDGPDPRGWRFLEALYPVVDAALARLRRLDSVFARSRAFDALLQQWPGAVAVVDGGGRVVSASAEALRLFAACGAAGDGQLPAALRPALQGLLHASPAVDASPRAAIVDDPATPWRRMRMELGAAMVSPRGRRHHLLSLAPERADATEPMPALPSLQALTPRERRVVLLVLEGLRTDEIAQRLCRSRKTIESQLGSVYRKLRVANRVQLVRRLQVQPPGTRAATG